MDNYFKIPGLKWRFGLDALIGLIPGAGDVVTGVIGLVLIIRAVQFGLPGIVIARMVLNTLIDFSLGSLPFLGDVIDFFWKSNSMNMQLFHVYAGSPKHSTRRHCFFVGALAVGIVAFFVLFAAVVTYATWRLLGKFFPQS